MEQRITWNSRERDTELCLVKGKSEDDCNNYIRVLAKTETNQLLVCGTNSYNPRSDDIPRRRRSFPNPLFNLHIWIRILRAAGTCAIWAQFIFSSTSKTLV